MTPPPDKPMVEYALEIAGRGFRVIPLHVPRFGTDGELQGCSCGNPDCTAVGKHPRTPHGVKDATRDRDRIAQWWRKWPDANIGIATGEGLVVLDVDGPAGEETLKGRPLPATVIAWSGRREGGRHCYFKAPAGVDLGNRNG